MDEVTEPLPYEWHQMLCQIECTRINYKHDYPRLEREFGDMLDEEWLEKTPELAAQFDRLFYGAAERTLGISSEEADLRLADFLARNRIKPTVVFFVILDRYRFCERNHRHFAALPTDRYIESVVHRAFQLLFEEALVSGLACIIDEDRIEELRWLCDEGADA
jgi:hypothetical protein